MHAFHNLPVRWKLTLVILGTSAVVLVLAGLALATYESLNFRQNLLIRARTLAELTADNAVSTLVFNRPDEANRILTLLRGRPDIVFAGIYNAEGKLIAQFTRDGQTVPEQIETLAALSHQFDGQELVVTVPVRSDNDLAGAFSMRMDFGDQRARFHAYLSIAGLTLVGLLGFALILAARLQRYFSAPILELAGAAQRVSQDHDYTVRARKFSGDEVGSLVDAFNQMLSEIQQRDESLRASEDRYRAVVEDQTEVICRFRQDGVILFVNEVYCRFFGKAAEELIGSSWRPRAMAEDLPAIEARLRALTVNHPVVAIENRVSGADGTLHWMQFINRGYFDGQGRLVEVQSVGRDITERKQAEEQIHRLNETLEQRVLERTLQLQTTNAALRASEARFRSYFELPLIGIAITSLNKGFLEINDRLCEIFGRSRRELMKMNWAQLTHPDDLTADAAQFKHVLAGESEGYAVEKRFLRGDGEVIHAAIALRCVRTAMGRVDYFVALAQDITERKRAEQERAQLFRQIEAANKRLELLSRRLIDVQEVERRSLSRELHDQIGQALTAIQITLQKAIAAPAGADLRPELGASLQLLDELVQQTQDLSLSLRPSLLDDLGLDAALQWLTDRQIVRAGLRGEFHPAPLEERLEPDIETACFRVTQEAITNALRHARASEIIVSLRREDAWLHLSVHDDGNGFDVKARVNSVERYKDLGLLGMEERVAQVAGRLEIESEPDSGTTVNAWFPLQWRTPDPELDAI